MASNVNGLQKAMSSYTSKYYLALSQQALDVQRNKELKEVQKKFENSKTKDIYNESNKAADKVMALRGYLDRVENAMDTMLDLKIQLFSAQDAVNTAAETPAGSNADNAQAFNVAIEALNSYAGNQIDSDAGNLIADSGDGYGTWTEDTETVSFKSYSSTINEHFSGSTYVIEADKVNGAAVDRAVYLEMDEYSSKLEGGGLSSDLGNWSLNSIDDNDNVSLTNTETGDTFSGKIYRGGVGVLSAWAYDGLDSADGRARALEDIQAALDKLEEIEAEYRSNQLQLTTMVDRGQAYSDAKNTEYQELSEKELTEKSAAETAINSKYDLQKNTLALTSGSGQEMLNQMFFTNHNASRKMGLSDALKATAGG